MVYIVLEVVCCTSEWYRKWTYPQILALTVTNLEICMLYCLGDLKESPDNIDGFDISYFL